jgi:hypothetical protein
MPGHVHYNLGTVDDVCRSMLRVSTTDTWSQSPPQKDSPAEASVSTAVDKVLHAIPPRSITGVFLFPVE